MKPPLKVASIPIPLPRDAVLRRLGHNRHHTQLSPEYKRRLEADLAAAFALCRPAGVWLRLPLKGLDDNRIVAEGVTIESASLAKLLSGCQELVLLATTVGSDIVEATQRRLEEHDGAGALVFDAVGSETADAAISYIHRQHLPSLLIREGAMVLKERFSPGYGDLRLEIQREIVTIMRLTELLGIQLTERCQMLPEKSVTAITGLRYT